MAGKRYSEARPRIIRRLELDCPAVLKNNLYTNKQSEPKSTPVLATAEWFEEDIAEFARYG